MKVLSNTNKLLSVEKGGDDWMMMRRVGTRSSEDTLHEILWNVIATHSPSA